MTLMGVPSKVGRECSHTTFLQRRPPAPHPPGLSEMPPPSPGIDARARGQFLSGACTGLARDPCRREGWQHTHSVPRLHAKYCSWLGRPWRARTIGAHGRRCQGKTGPARRGKIADYKRATAYPEIGCRLILRNSHGLGGRCCRSTRYPWLACLWVVTACECACV